MDGRCPSHHCPCIRGTSKDGRHFVKCPKGGCKYFRWGAGSGASAAGSSPARKSPQSAGKRRRSGSSGAQAAGALYMQLASRTTVVLKEPKSSAAAQKVRSAMQQSAVPGASLDEGAGEWTLPVASQEAAVKALKGVGVTALPVPSEPLEALSALKVSEVSDFSSLPEALFSSLMPFQQRGFLFAVERGGRCLFADEMGLGKTVQAIAVAGFYRSEWPLLVVCPSSVKLNWALEIKRWIPDVPQHQINVVNTAKDRARSLVNICSYDLVTKMDLKPGEFNVVIADESHYLKNSDTIRTRKVVPLLQAAKRALLLTGTPALSRPIELYPQLAALGVPIFSTMVQFGKRYCAAFRGPYGWDYTGHSNLKELHTVLSETVMIRRLKADVVKELPDKRRRIVRLELDEEGAELAKAMKDRVGRLKQSSRDVPGLGLNEDKRAVIMDLFTETARAKIGAVVRYVENQIKEQPERKFLVFAHHQVLLDAVEDRLVNLKTKYVRIDGSTLPKKREEMVERFQQDEQCLVAVLSLTAAGTGITLNAADLVLFAELYWTPGVLMQAEDRVHRIGQTNTVGVRFLLASGTVDDIIWPLVEKKLVVLGNTVDGEERHMEASKNADEDLTSKGRQQKSRAQSAARTPLDGPKQKTLFDFFGTHNPFCQSDAKTDVGSAPCGPGEIIVEEISTADSESEPPPDGGAAGDVEDGLECAAETPQLGLLWNPHDGENECDGAPILDLDDLRCPLPLVDEPVPRSTSSRALASPPVLLDDVPSPTGFQGVDSIQDDFSDEDVGAREGTPFKLFTTRSPRGPIIPMHKSKETNPPSALVPQTLRHTEAKRPLSQFDDLDTHEERPNFQSVSGHRQNKDAERKPPAKKSKGGRVEIVLSDDSDSDTGRVSSAAVPAPFSVAADVFDAIEDDDEDFARPNWTARR